MTLPKCPFCKQTLTIEYREPIRDYVWECDCSIETLKLNQFIVNESAYAKPLTKRRVQSDIKPTANGSVPDADFASAAMKEAYRIYNLGRDHGRAEQVDLIAWADSLICNAKPMNHCTQEDWDQAVKKWRDQKHGVFMPVNVFKE